MKSFFTAILSLWLLLGSFVSCNPLSTPSAVSVTFDSLTFDTICPLFKNYPKPACHLCFNLSVPSEQTTFDLKEEIEHFLCLLPKDGSLEIPSEGKVVNLVHCYVRDYVMGYLSEGPNAIDNYGGDTLAASTWMSYDEKVTGRILYNANGFLSYQLRTESYTGGAHGNSSVDNAVLSYKTGERLVLSDLFADSSLENLNALIRQKLVQNNQCQSLEELTEKCLFFAPSEIEVNENFYLDESGITWVYDPYDIAPYCMGEVMVSINWKETIDFLSADSEVTELANLFASASAL